MTERDSALRYPSHLLQLLGIHHAEWWAEHCYESHFHAINLVLGSTEPSFVGKTHYTKVATFAQCFTSFQYILQWQLESLIVSITTRSVQNTYNMAVLKSSGEDPSSPAARLPTKDTLDSDSRSERHTCPQTLTTTAEAPKDPPA